MPIYQAPLRDQQFVLHELLDVTKEYQAIPEYDSVDVDTINQVLEEAGKFCTDVLFPLNLSGDGEGCTFNPQTNEVSTPKGYKEAYQQFCENGWSGLSADPQYGGQGLPALIQNVFFEMQYSTNQAWSMYPGLTQGAYACLAAHGTPEQQKTYLPNMVAGNWTGTMCLTEPHCGTDLGLIRTKAVPAADGSYKISGTKIFISSGEHDMAENIVHLVLAKLPDAPAGTKGISLFIVPKFIPDADGKPGERNAAKCVGIEHKMGIHGNSTCQMLFEDATGYLVSEPHKGLAAMFVMMNGARLGVGVQGLGLTEVAYQNAVAYARDRLQMRALSGAKFPEKAADPIIVHPDVRRMLLTMRAYAEGSRAFAYWVGVNLDKSLKHPDPEVRKEAGDLLALTTPVLKAFLTDNGFQCASLGMQVFGGHGFVWETGAEQYVRDARINMIYEGTNGIQALDLLGRKVLGDGGAALQRFGKLVGRFVKENQEDAQMAEFIKPLAALGEQVTQLTMEIGTKAFQNRDEVGAASVDYLRIVGHLIHAYFWAQMAKIALAKQDSGDKFYAAKLTTARFYFARLLPEVEFHIRAAKSGADVVMAMDADLF